MVPFERMGMSSAEIMMKVVSVSDFITFGTRAFSRSTASVMAFPGMADVPARSVTVYSSFSESGCVDSSADAIGFF